MPTNAPQKEKLRGFIRTVWSHYRAHGRHDMPWRRDTSPYAVVVSEIMLQQTQVSRVAAKFPAFMRRFPDWRSLAAAPTSAVLAEWSGLGYNRRALYLKRIAEAVVREHGGELPDTYDALRRLPGIGPNTAGSILAFAFDRPHPFIETNIRSAFLHHFFPRARTKVRDGTLMPLIATALADTRAAAHPRQWHWALMDYGADLKSRLDNPSRRSAHHVRQKAFKGSARELRSRILRAVMARPTTKKALERGLGMEWPIRLIGASLDALVREGFIVKAGARYRVAA